MMWRQRHGVLLFSLYLALVIGCQHSRPKRDQPPAAPAITDARQLPALSATQWMQTSAEYEALCRQVYAQATEKVLAAVAAHKGPKPPAVVMDLDETVIDNGWYQAQRMRKGKTGWNMLEWHDYVNNHWQEGRSVPGAIEFIKRMRQEGVEVFFISNRSQGERPGTFKTLNKLGVGEAEMEDDDSRHLLLRQISGSKDDRREAVAATHEILALIGDNLGDMSGAFDKSAQLTSIDQRRQLAIENAAKFGTQWFVLPNPLYGEWDKFVNTQDPLSDLYPAAAPAPGPAAH